MKEIVNGYEQLFNDAVFDSKFDAYVLSWVEIRDGKAEFQKRTYKDMDRLLDYLDKLFLIKADIINNVQLKACYKLSEKKESQSTDEQEPESEQLIADRKIAMKAMSQALKIGTISLDSIQQDFSIGFSTAIRIFDRLEEMGLIKCSANYSATTAYDILKTAEEVMVRIKYEF